MKKGFTLIELLAVIVILAIIALITIPAILKMVDNARVSSYRRSIDLYGRAINSAVAAYKSDKIEKHESYQVSFPNVESYIDYEGYDINCKESKIYSDDTILLTECTVEKDLVYGEKGKGYGKDNYYYYTNATKRIKILEYADAINKALEGKEYTANTCGVQEDGNLICNGQTIEITSNLEKPISGTIAIQNNKVTSYSQLKFADKKIETVEEIPTIVDAGEINTGNNQNNNNNNTNQVITISASKNYRGYYADVDGDGTVDGVIYADLAFSQSGDWYNKDINWGQGYGTYSYTAQTNLKEYTISKNKYKRNDGFGEKEIITLKPNSSGNKRFYVMSLTNFTTGSYTEGSGYSEGSYSWYKNAESKMPDPVKDTSTDFGTGYTNTGTMIRIWNNNGEEAGWTSGATKSDYDIFKHIQGEYEKGWYIPSRGEWGAFGDYLANREENSLTNNCSTEECNDNGNYDDKFELSDYYWSSSQDATSSDYTIEFDYGIMSGTGINSIGYVRLGYTF